MENKGEKSMILQTIHVVRTEQGIEQKAYGLYSAMTAFLLSKDFFPSNADLHGFIDPLLVSLNKHRQSTKLQPLKIGDYAFKSRTILISRMIRLIQHANFVELSLILSSIEKAVNPSRRNQADKLLERFGRK